MFSESFESWKKSSKAIHLTELCNKNKLKIIEFIGGPPEGNWWQLPHLKKLTRSKARVKTHSKILCVRSIPSGGRVTPQSLTILFFGSMIFDEIL